MQHEQRSARPCSLARASDSEMPPARQGVSSAYINLALALLSERHRGPASPHWHYLRCLPDVNQTATSVAVRGTAWLWFDPAAASLCQVELCPSLPCFTDAELDELEDPFAAEVAKADREVCAHCFVLASRGGRSTCRFTFTLRLSDAHISQCISHGHKV